MRDGEFASQRFHADPPFAPLPSEAYPSCTVTDVRLGFDVHKLMRLDLERYGKPGAREAAPAPCASARFVFSRRKAMKGRLYFATKAQKDGKILIKTHPCAQIFCCDICGFEKVRTLRQLGGLRRLYLTTGWHWCRSRGCWCTATCPGALAQVDAEQYYSEMEEKWTDEFNAEKNRVSMKRLGIAFVTFRDERMTAV